jgi:hypothetical protein
MRTHTNTHTHIHTQTNTHTHTQTHTHTNKNTQTHTHTHTHTHAHTHTHTRTHTHTNIGANATFGERTSLLVNEGTAHGTRLRAYLCDSHRSTCVRIGIVFITVQAAEWSLRQIRTW